MISQSFIVDFLGKSAGTLNDTKKKEPVNTHSYPKFRETLNTAVDSNSLANKDKQVKRSVEFNTDNGIDKNISINAKADELQRNNKIKSYRDAVREKDQVSSKKEIKSVDNGRLDEAIKDEVLKSEATIVEESLAAILNISVDELRKVLSTLNISSEDLTDEAKTFEVAQKISNLFGLNSEQKETLTKVTNFIVREAKSLVSEIQPQNINKEKNLDKEGWVKLEGIDVEVLEHQQKLPLENLTMLGDKLKEILNKLDNKLDSEKEKLFENISNKMEELAISNVKTVKATTDQKDVIDDLAVTTSEEKIQPKISTTSDESGKAGEKEADSSSEGKAQRVDLLDTDAGEAVENITQDTKQGGFENIINNQQIKVNGTNDVAKVQSEVTVSKKEIITQIVEKAKVVLTDEKSEMIIDLKPDHLGKLSLKVVTERGAVVAKFIAESEQVKAAIESNMDNLKQSLTKQGFSIEGFSVSVGQDPKRRFDEAREFSQNNSRSNKGDKMIAAASVGVSSIEERHQILNPYMVNNSSINLTA